MATLGSVCAHSPAVSSDFVRKKMGTSLWLVPLQSSPATGALQNLIASLAETYTSPSFPPHITLASLPACISLPEIVSSLSSEEPLEISFDGVRTGQTFFQSVFIGIQASVGLSKLHEHVHKILGVQPKTPEFAHLSLYYGDDHKEEVSRNLFADGVVQPAEPSGVSVAGVCRFIGGQVWVVKCEGKPEDWLVIEKVTLGEPLQQ